MDINNKPKNIAQSKDKKTTSMLPTVLTQSVKQNDILYNNHTSKQCNISAINQYQQNQQSQQQEPNYYLLSGINYII